MRVFVTGATGFIGTELVRRLLSAGHQVLGLTRSDAGAEQLKAAGALVQRGDIQDIDSLRAGAHDVDAVVNLAFDHDMSRFAENARNEARAIEALGSALAPGKLLLVTSGVAIASRVPGRLPIETDPPLESDAIPRRSEQAALRVAERGVNVGILRLSQVHDTRKQGLVSYLVRIAKDRGVSAYVGDGAFRWAAAPLEDVAQLYHLALERDMPGVTTYHAVQEEGVSLRSIAEAIGKRLSLPVVSIAGEQVQQHFGMFAPFATLHIPASSEWTRSALGWNPTGPGLIEDLTNME